MTSHNNREKIVVRTSVLSILANFLLAGFKAAVGLASNSIAIISDAINNTTDALSSLITIIGTKLANKAPDKKHPYGYGRVEYLTSLIISMIVLYAGLAALIESVKKIFMPEEVDYGPAAIIVVAAGVAVKCILGMYVKKKGRDSHSDSLVASGADAFNDAILSASVLVSAIVYLIFRIDVEAYVSTVLALFIIKTGVDLIKKSINNILETRLESKLSQSIKREIAKEPDVEGVFDLVLNNYGPDQYLGSVHIEVPDTMTVAEIDKISRRITKDIMKKYGVLLHTIGVYSINTKDKNIIKLRKDLEKIVFSHKDVLQMHGFYYDEQEKNVSFDIIIDFESKDREQIYKEIYSEAQELFPGCNLAITLDVDASD
ncbi:cation transporter [Candidatus Saccharibacteria bacterium]|nr:cation transporter [Candidatus Saccharibacteria bacterium]